LVFLFSKAKGEREKKRGKRASAHFHRLHCPTIPFVNPLKKKERRRKGRGKEGRGGFFDVAFWIQFYILCSSIKKGEKKRKKKKSKKSVSAVRVLPLNTISLTTTTYD